METRIADALDEEEQVRADADEVENRSQHGEHEHPEQRADHGA